MCGGVCPSGRCRGCWSVGLGSQGADEFAEALEFEGGLAGEGLCVGVVPDAVAAAHDRVRRRRNTVFLVPEERGDLSQVVVDEQDRELKSATRRPLFTSALMQSPLLRRCSEAIYGARFRL